MKKIRVCVNDLMQKNYIYHLTEPMGENFHPEFKPQLTPKEMLEMGVFGGKYMTDCTDEFPADWFADARLCHERHVPEFNFYGVNASKPLSYWREKGWVHEDDPRGWFQWYCRYYMGRRGGDDVRQIKRLKAMARHIAQLRKNCPEGVLACRKKQRQALCTGRMTAGRCDAHKRGQAALNPEKQGVPLFIVRSMTVRKICFSGSGS